MRPSPRIGTGCLVARSHTVFFARVLGQADPAGLLSKEYVSVDDALIEALASFKSSRPEDEDRPPTGGGRNPDADFQGEERSWDTHESKTYKGALLIRKGEGTAADLSYTFADRLIVREVLPEPIPGAQGRLKGIAIQFLEERINQVSGMAKGSGSSREVTNAGGRL